MKELKVSPIREGTVIDHITSGKALIVLRILRLSKDFSNIVSVLMNVVSTKMGRKDVIKVEGIELDKKTVNKIALVSPTATINIIRDYKVVEKYKVEIPNEIVGIVKCNNPNCITNSGEPAEARFRVISKNPVKIRCHYCGRIMEMHEIEKNIL